MTTRENNSEDSSVPPKSLIGVDPGKSTGWIIFKDNQIHEFGTCRSIEEFDIWLHEQEPPDVLVMEDFKLFSWKAKQQSGSNMPASKVIGIVESWCRRNKVKLVTQPSNILSIAVKWSKVPMPKNHNNSHHISALNHAIYYLVKNNYMDPVGM